MNYRKPWLIAQAVIVIGIVVLDNSEPALSQGRKPTTPTEPPVKIDSGSLNTVPTRPLLKAGSQGTDVVELQGILKLLGYYTGTLSGTYEQTTVAAVSQFQKAAGLSVDGVVGSETWNRLLPPSPRLVPPTPTSGPSPTSSGETFPNPSPTKAGPSQKPANSAGTLAKQPVAKGSGDRPATSQPETATFPTLRLGMKGPAVAGLQERLRALGYLKSTADGVFGPETQAAVKAAQRKLSLDADGIVGSATWTGLLR